MAGTGVAGYFMKEQYDDSKPENDNEINPYDLGKFGRYEFFLYTTSLGVILAILSLVALITGLLEKKGGTLAVSSVRGIQQYIFLLFHLEELLKLYVNLFYRFCVTLLFLEIFEQKKSQIS